MVIIFQFINKINCLNCPYKWNSPTTLYKLQITELLPVLIPITFSLYPENQY